MTCEKCGGCGFIETPRYLPDGELSSVIDSTACECRLFKELDEQAERTWAGLSSIPVQDDRLFLKDYLNKNMHITSDLKGFALTLRSALWGKGNPTFIVKVVDDSMLMSVWLSNIHESGHRVIDPDFDYTVPVRDLLGFTRPDLLIVRLGVKNSRNIATPEVLAEVLSNRKGAFKKTWVIDSQEKPLREGHISWSLDVKHHLESFERVDLTFELPQASVSTSNTSMPKTVKSVKPLDTTNKTGIRTTFKL